MHKQLQSQVKDKPMSILSRPYQACLTLLGQGCRYVDSGGLGDPFLAIFATGSTAIQPICSTVIGASLGRHHSIAQHKTGDISTTNSLSLVRVYTE
jgi:hypothetical protein